MAIPNFFQQSQQAMQQGMQLGSALRNAQAMEEQRQFAKQMQPYQIEEAKQQALLRPLQVEQQQLQNKSMAQENLRKDLAQDAILLSSLSEEDGKKVIPQLINKYEGNDAVVAGFNKLFKSTGKDYIKSSLMAVSAFTGKPIGGEKERNLSDPEKNLETMDKLESNLSNAQASGDQESIANATARLDNFKKLTNKFGASAQEKQDIKTSAVTDKSNIQRRQGFIDSAVDAADGYGVLKRSVDLLDSVSTGGFDAAALKAKQLFGIESADEAELSSNMGKAILAQLKPIFGAAFTEKEGARLEAIEANFGKSTEGNKRLLKEAMKISERAMRRGLSAAKKEGDDFVVEELERMMAEFEKVENPMDGGTDNQEQKNIANNADLTNLSLEELKALRSQY